LERAGKLLEAVPADGSLGRGRGLIHGQLPGPPAPAAAIAVPGSPLSGLSQPVAVTRTDLQWRHYLLYLFDLHSYYDADY